MLAVLDVAPVSVKQDPRRTCEACGEVISAAAEFCPFCALRAALEPEPVGSDIEPPPCLSGLQFDHYEILTREDGAPFELGRGAMGVTYKAFDRDLRLPVTLKVISKKYVGDEAARRRFLREARSAAKVRHTNVASVLHLGRTENGYFYAMEFVEGETLESLIQRRGSLEVKLALEIAGQTASGLAAVQKQRLVHRDIKPSNIMVSLGEGGDVIVKIIDLGLAKGVDESTPESAISMLGGFAGTPDFAGPEQFAGIVADIRSDLYSLGVTLWVMLTGRPPFRGKVAELIYQHQHAALPLKELQGVPHQVTALLKMLLEKDPKRRFQTPVECLNRISTVRSELEKPARRTRLSRSKPQQRSVAVLPFESLSSSKKDTYFTDGVQDEILSNLAKVSQLTVISRTSVMAFRPRDNRNLSSIAQSLGVANVVEGTVRRDGKHVRLTVRLIDARTDKVLWAECYDRDLTDIFTIQSEVAQTIARKLTVGLSPREKKRIEAKPTDNLEAYDLYLRGKELIASTTATLTENLTEALRKAIPLLTEAVRLDPNFTLAYCSLATAHASIYHFADKSQERRASADRAMNTALQLQADLPEVHLAYAYYLYGAYRAYDRARVQLAMARRDLPNDAAGIVLAAYMDRRQGAWDKAIEEFNEAMTRDPRNPESIVELGNTLFWTRRFRESERVYDQLIELLPEQPILKVQKAFTLAMRTGDDTPVAKILAELPGPMNADDTVLCWRLRLALRARDWQLAKGLIKSIKADEDDGRFGYGFMPVPIGCYSILFTRLGGGQVSACNEFAQTREKLCRKVQEAPANALLLSKSGLVDALLDNKEAALSAATQSVEMFPLSIDAMDGPGIQMNLAIVYGWIGELDLAFEILEPLIRLPNGVYYGQLKLDPYWEPIRKDPRSERLLAQLAPNQSLQKQPSSASHVRAHKGPIRLGPKKVSLARLPVTGTDLFGREEDIAFLDDAWANKDVNVFTIVAWAGVGKSTLVNHWLRRMAADHYRCAELVFGWSFYRQGTSGETSSADEFLDAALAWFGDPDPRLGTGWEKGERLAKLVADRRALLILDGLEPLQNPPGSQEGRLREPALQALLRELAAFNKGLCVITTRAPVADIADHEQTSALRCDLEQLSSEVGAKLLRALGVKGDEAELRSASGEFGGHCLALTLLGSYLTDAYNGDIRCRSQALRHLAQDVRQGDHARKVMGSYQDWLGEGPELAVLCMLGLFDRPADEQALGALVKSPAIPGLTESLTDLRPAEWRKILAKLRRARLLSPEDSQNPGRLDTHPLVREYFGEQLKNQRTEAWKECNKRLYDYYRTVAPKLPETFQEMEPLFLAAIHGCNAGLFREALHEVYIRRIQRGDSSFAANSLGARGTLLSVLGQFFESGRWESAIVKGTEEHSLSDEDQLFILLQGGQYLTATRGFGAPGVRVCYERAESLAMLSTALTSCMCH